jgi:hypothetical protein
MPGDAPISAMVANKKSLDTVSYAFSTSRYTAAPDFPVLTIT